MRRWWLLGASALMLVACTDGTGLPTAVQLGFTVAPTNATAGSAIVVTVAIQDASGFTVTRATNVVTVTIGTGPTGGTLGGTVSVAAVNGVASFPSLRVDKAGIGYTLKATATGLIQATSASFNIAASAATKVAFTVQPGNTMTGGPINPPVEVAAQDSFGNIATGFRDVVTVALGGNPAPGTLSGTTAVSAVGGYATFGDLSIAQVSPGYTLTANALGLTGVTSTPFAIAKPTGSLRITTTTTGAPDPDGYAICVDSTSDSLGVTTCAYGGPLAIAVNGIGAVVTVDTGAHAVRLMGVAAHCTVGNNPYAVHASRGGTIALSFAVACAQPTLHITTATTGASLPNGYSVCVDAVRSLPDPWGFDNDYVYVCTTSPSPIGLNGGVTVPVAPGSHLVYLDGVADNCEVGSDNPRSVEAGAPSEVPFAVTCFATGSVRVRTATNGTDVDPDGYSVCVDRSGNCYWYAQAHANDVVTIAGVSAGLHTVQFDGLAGNCTASGGTARAVTVPADGTVDVTFNVGCVQAERIAYTSGGAITVSQLGGSVTQTIGPGSAPAWSPDGARLAYECDQDLCAINADGTGFARLSFDRAGKRHPAWSPDGLRIAFSATHGGDLYVMAVDGSGVVRLTQQGVGALGSPAWSPDGSTIAFDCSVDVGGEDICVVKADGTGFARLTTDPGRDYGAAWKPDGSMLAFATTRYGTDEIVLMSPAGGGVTRIGAGLPGFAPTWSPDGTQLAFVQTQYQSCDGWDYAPRPASSRAASAPPGRADPCNPYDVVTVAHSDGSVVRAFASGDQPAWRPHR